jgi:hypothetical protein
VIWETFRSNKQRFKPLSVKDCLAVEEAFVHYSMEIAAGRAVNPRVFVDAETEVNI